MRLLSTLSAFVMLSSFLHADEAPKPAPIQDTFLLRDGVLSFESETWSAKTKGSLGWTSLKIGDADFLFSTETVGGFLFNDQDPSLKGTPLFPDRDNISHDEMVGHLGQVGNGVHLIRLAADPKLDWVELYFGANSAEDLLARMFLSNEVKEVKLEKGFTRPGDPAVKTRKATLVHQSGREILIESSTSPGNGPDGKPLPPPEFEIGMVKHPSGKEVLAVTFPCPGFKANPFRLSFEGKNPAPSLVAKPTFKVISSDDPKEPMLGAANGVLNPVYTPETKLDFGMQFEWNGGEPFQGYAELEVIHSLGKPHYYERVELNGRPPGPVGVTFQPKFHLPGVSEVWVRLVDANGRMLWNDRYRMAYDIEHFQPDIQVEPDFQAFWDRTLKELREVPLDPKTVRVEKYRDVPRFEIYQVSFNGWKGKRIHALMYVPREGKRPLPALVTGHPAVKGFDINKGPDGVFGSNIRHDPRFVTLIPIVQGYEPDSPDIPFNYPWWGLLDDRDTYVARSWYCSLVRAVDYLATRPDLVDMNRVIASGGSQGGDSPS